MKYITRPPRMEKIFQRASGGGDLVRGKDTQLEAAVQYLTKLIKEKQGVKDQRRKGVTA